jgi:hypothetical protein
VLVPASRHLQQCCLLSQQLQQQQPVWECMFLQDVTATGSRTLRVLELLLGDQAAEHIFYQLMLLRPEQSQQHQLPLL